MTYREVADTCEHFSYGLKALDLIPDVDIDGKTYRFLAIFCKNRMERYLAHIGNMYQNVTTIAIYQNLNDSEKSKIFEDTECTTMLVSYELLSKVIRLKQKDSEGKLAKLTNLITFCPDHAHSLNDDE
jgi:long-subunit acyl-CoA synthetase (AMP-forming)